MLALSAENLKKSYKNGVVALKNIDLQVHVGDFFALLGLNGAGKSTLIRIICSLIKKTAGQVRIFDYSLDEELKKAKACIGLVPQEFNFNTLESVYDILINHAGYYSVPIKTACERAKIYLKKLGLWEKRYVCSRTLSGGMKRRLMIIRALLHQPKLLILDEPTAGIDIESRYLMWDFLKEINQQFETTIIMTTHYLEEAEKLCKNIAVIDQGVIIENTSMSNLLAKSCGETFEIHLSSPLQDIKPLAAYLSKLIDPLTLAIDLKKGDSLSDIFLILSTMGINIISIKNKANNLEEIFMRLTSNHASPFLIE